MTFWKWSRTASSNSTADSTCPFPEGMNPGALNDGTRGMMAATAKYRDDIAGAIVTGGTSSAYTVSSYQVFDSLAHMDGAMIAFSPHATNGTTVTLNVDGLGAKPLRSAPSAELLAGTIILGTPYTATYNNLNAEWILHGFYGNPYSIPLLGGLDYWDTVAPNSSFIFPAGQAISRTTYAAAFARIGTTHGSGDGSTTFNVPDKTERVSVMKASSASRLTSSYFGGDSTAMGAVGGLESHTLTKAQSAVLTYTAAVTDPSHLHGGGYGGSSPGNGGNFGAGPPFLSGVNVGPAFTGITVGVTADAGGGAHNNVQPTIVCNYIMRII